MTIDLSDRGVELLDLLRLYWPDTKDSTILDKALDCYCQYLAIDLGLFDHDSFVYAWRRYHCFEGEV